MSTEDTAKRCGANRLGLFKDEDVIAVENLRLAGQFHWLVMPKAHTIRDIEALNGNHLNIRKFCQSQFYTFYIRSK
jgi:hypothetical protein